MGGVFHTHHCITKDSRYIVKPLLRHREDQDGGAFAGSLHMVCCSLSCPSVLGLRSYASWHFLSTILSGPRRAACSSPVAVFRMNVKKVDTEVRAPDPGRLSTRVFFLTSRRGIDSSNWPATRYTDVRLAHVRLRRHPHPPVIEPTIWLSAPLDPYEFRNAWSSAKNYSATTHGRQPPCASTHEAEDK